MVDSTPFDPHREWPEEMLLCELMLSTEYAYRNKQNELALQGCRTVDLRTHRLRSTIAAKRSLRYSRAKVFHSLLLSFVRVW
jgi:hypothetical protein